jgi:hypothetical protein
MYKPSIYLVIAYFLTYLSTYIWDLFPTELVTKVKPNINSVEVHPQLSNNRHPVDGVLVGAGSLSPSESWALTKRKNKVNNMIEATSVIGGCKSPLEGRRCPWEGGNIHKDKCKVSGFFFQQILLFFQQNFLEFFFFSVNLTHCC